MGGGVDVESSCSVLDSIGRLFGNLCCVCDLYFLLQ
jgi:hypothetical protein